MSTYDMYSANRTATIRVVDRDGNHIRTITAATVNCFLKFDPFVTLLEEHTRRSPGESLIKSAQIEIKDGLENVVLSPESFERVKEIIKNGHGKSSKGNSLHFTVRRQYYSLQGMLLTQNWFYFLSRSLQKVMKNLRLKLKLKARPEHPAEVPHAQCEHSRQPRTPAAMSSIIFFTPLRLVSWTFSAYFAIIWYWFITLDLAP